MRRRSNKETFCTLKRVFFVSLIVFLIWLFIAPASFIREMNTHSSVRDYTKNKPQSQVISEDPRLLIQQVIESKRDKTKLWTLKDAKTLELRGLDWYEKGKLIVQHNEEYLHKSVGRGNSTSSSITLVSGLFDLGRGELKNDFSRSFDFYVKRFSVFLRYKFPKIIFIQPEHHHLYKPYIDESEYPVHVIYKTLDEIRAFPFFDQIDQIRTDPDWYLQEGWLSNSPQATLPLYNPMVMSKILWTTEAAQINPFDTDSFLWFDGGHQCNEPDYIFESNANIFREHFDKLLITYFDYEPNKEIHGFKRKEFFDYIDYRARSVLVGRGGVFGGTREYLEVASEVYMLALEDTLKSGYMGTEENIFSILYYRFPELVHDYFNGPGGNCAIFYEAIHGPQPLPPPPPVFHIVEDGLDLRGATCSKESGKLECYANGRLCPSYVTPFWLHRAEGQGSCTETNSRRFCTVDCPHNAEVLWFAHDCNPYDICPPHGTIHWSVFYDKNPLEDPQAAYSPTEEIIDGLDLRGATCEQNGRCMAGGLCPVEVTPMYLHEAKGQGTCTLEGYYCTVTCSADSISWHGHKCSQFGKCPPYSLTPWDSLYLENPFVKYVTVKPSIAAPVEPVYDLDFSYAINTPPPIREKLPPSQIHFTDREKEYMIQKRQTFDTQTKEYLKKYGFDLRGLQCEILNGKEVCFAEHRGGRDMCPDWVDSVHLSMSPGQYSCTGEDPDTYCTAMCQEGVDRVAWMAHNVEWCVSNPGNCAKKPPIIPYDEFYIQEWTMDPIPIKPCEEMDSTTLQALQDSAVPFTVGILCRGNELLTLDLSMQTWLSDGFLQYASEVLIMVNEIEPEMEIYLEQFQSYPVNLRVLSSEKNEGILNGINWLMGNSTNEYFLFLEKDFRLVEPLSCAVEQISSGIELIETKRAHVVKYRSRYNAGRPNWAEVSYKGREEDIFRSQRNLLCNFYHWIDRPAQRWPNHFDVCMEDPVFYCVDSEFCNWTNNPFMVNKIWWYENYVFKFDEIRNPAPDFNLEGFMNWAAGAWNDRGWIVAEGDGLFKHCDANNFGQ